MDLSLFPENLRDMAAKELAAGDVLGFLSRASNELSIKIVFENIRALKSRGLLERAIRCAVTATRTNNRLDEHPMLKVLLASADRTRLLEAGDPLPHAGPWRLYRGVGGKGGARRVRGYSWTMDRNVADWFAKRARSLGLEDPAVYSVLVTWDHVLFFSHERKEAEFFLSLPSDFPVTRLPGSQNGQPGR